MASRISSLDYWRSDVSKVDKAAPKIDGNRPFWNQDLPILNSEGKIIRGGMWEKQREWWNLNTFIKALIGGYGSGKTYIGAKRIIGLSLHNPGCMTAAVSPTFPQAKKTIIPTIKALLSGKQTLDPTLWWKYNKNDHVFFIRHKGRDGIIQVMSADDPDSLRGPNIAAVWLDEPFIMSVEAFIQMMARIRHPDARLKELSLTGTPEQLNWGYDLLMGEMKEQYELAGITIGMVQASSRQNLATGSHYIKQLEGAFTEKAAEAYIEGGFVNLSKGQVYYAFKSLGEESNVRSLEVPSGAELGCGMDFNVNPMSAAVFWKAGDHVHIFDEFEMPNADTELLCTELYDKYVNPSTRVLPNHVLQYVYPDASGSARKTSAPAGKTDFHFIREAGFQIKANPSNPKVKDRYNSVNGKLKNSAGKVSLTVSPKCKKLIRYYLTYTHELSNKPEQKAMSHLLDASSYPLAYLFPIKGDVGRSAALVGH